MCCFYSLVQTVSALRPRAKTMWGQFPAHNNSIKRDWGVTRSHRGFTSSDTPQLWPSRNTDWKAAHDYKVPKNVKSGCPKRGNFTYHIFPVMAGCVCVCAVYVWVCVCVCVCVWGILTCDFTPTQKTGFVRKVCVLLLWFCVTLAH